MKSFANQHSIAKNILLLINFLALTFLMATITFGQSYRTLDANRVASFQAEIYNMEQYNKYLNYCEGKDCVIGIRIDSISSDSQTMFFPVYARGQELDSEGGICPSVSWLGPKVDFLPDGKNLFYNGMDDTIVIQTNAEVGASWNLFNLTAGSYFQATVNSITSESILGITDSVKYINLQLKDLNGSNLPHDLNGLQILIGKEQGLISTPDLFHFPNDATLKTLVGLTNPDVGIQILNSKSIYNYSVGQERHIYKECSNSLDYSYSYVYLKEIILEKDTIANEVFYTIDRTRYSLSGGAFGTDKDTSYFRDTFVEELFEYKRIQMDLHPFEMSFDEFAYPYGFNFQFFTSINNKQGLGIRDDFSSGIPNCLSTFIDINVAETFLGCMGLVIWDYFSFPTYCYENLVYYKKGTEEWGTPINFEELTSVEEIKLPITQHQISPNPANQSILIQTKNTSTPISSWTLYDLNGIVHLQAKHLLQHQVQIQVASLPNGLYQLEIKDKNSIPSRYSLMVIH